MDLERLTSGKFGTHALVLPLGQVAYNALQLCGRPRLRRNRQLLLAKQRPLRKPAIRRRLRSVIEDLMYQVTRWTYNAHRWICRSDRTILGMAFGPLCTNGSRAGHAQPKPSGSKQRCGTSLEVPATLETLCSDSEPNTVLASLEAPDPFDRTGSCRNDNAHPYQNTRLLLNRLFSTEIFMI